MPPAVAVSQPALSARTRRVDRLDRLAAQRVPFCVTKRKLSVGDFDDLPDDVFNVVHSALLNAKLSARNVLPILQLARERDWPDVHAHGVSFIRDSFSGLLIMLGAPALRSALGDNVFETLHQEHVQALEEIHNLRVLGRPIEHTWPAGLEPAPDGTLPYAALSLTLSTWPAFVDPRKREAYLSDAEFVRVLHLPRAQFYSQARWRQQRAKSEAHLL